ncbi:MAG: hypothetical protein LBU86_02180 [Oscillospiraceae bacterium]|nr:hypothetical protein [Oscillospiraceae bacterium]
MKSIVSSKGLPISFITGRDTSNGLVFSGGSAISGGTVSCDEDSSVSDDSAGEASGVVLGASLTACDKNSDAPLELDNSFLSVQAARVSKVNAIMEAKILLVVNIMLVCFPL